MRFILPLLLVLATPVLGDEKETPKTAPEVSTQIEKERAKILMKIKLLRLRVQLLSADLK